MSAPLSRRSLDTARATMAAVEAARARGLGGPPEDVSCCTRCSARRTCSTPCAILRAELGPEVVEAPQEISSPALMAGRGYSDSFMVQPEAERLWAPPDVRRSTLADLVDPDALRGAVDSLLPAQKEIVGLMLDGKSRPEINRIRGVSRQATHKVLLAAKRKLVNMAANLIDPTKVAALQAEVERLQREVDERPPPPGEVLAIDSGKHTRVIDVTPELAARWLETMPPNRAPYMPHVEKLARDLTNGMWRTTAQGFGLGRDAQGNDVLRDGMHRCLAIKLSGVTARVVVTFGLTDDDIEVTDAGRPRSVVDSLRIADGDEAPSASEVSWIRSVAVLEARAHIALSTAQARVLIQRFRSSLAFLSAHGPVRLPLRKMPVMGAFCYAHRVQPEAVEAFVKAYVTGSNLPDGSAILLARSYILTPATRDTERVITLKILRAIQAHIEGEKLEQLKASDGVFEYWRKQHERLDGILDAPAPAQQAQPPATASDAAAPAEEPTATVVKARKPRAKKSVQTGEGG